MKRCTLLALILAFLPSLFSQTQKNVTLVGQLDYTPSLNDIWGYVDDNGNEYALVGAQTGFSIVDLSDPTNPVQLQFIPGFFSVWRDIKTYGHYAYVSNDDGGGLTIVDLSTLPGQVVHKDTVMQGITHTHNLYIDNGILYMAGPDQFNGGLAMYDLTNDPWRPNFVGAYSVRYVHDVYVRNNLAYAAEINDGLLTILDVTNPGFPQTLGSRDYINSFTHNTWLNDASNVVFTTDELSDAYLYAWDISDPGNIIELDRIRSSLSNGTATPHNTHVLDDYLVTSYYRDGLNIVDASRPSNLIETGYYDTSPLSGGGFNGAWGAYPFLPSGLILVSDIESGLFVFDVNFVREYV
ncbi:MAG: choice-of-anchor B family protein [Bacteroidota bacterium]